MAEPTTPKAKGKERRLKSKDKKRKRHSSPRAPEAKKARIEVSRVPATTTTNTNTPYRITTTSFYLGLAPKYSYNPEKTFAHLLSRSSSSEQAAHLRSLSPITGVQKHHLDPLLMTYYEPVDGVIIA